MIEITVCKSVVKHTYMSLKILIKSSLQFTEKPKQI